jgi:hypothetical protein
LAVSCVLSKTRSKASSATGEARAWKKARAERMRAVLKIIVRFWTMSELGKSLGTGQAGSLTFLFAGCLEVMGFWKCRRLVESGSGQYARRRAGFILDEGLQMGFSF